MLHILNRILLALGRPQTTSLLRMFELVYCPSASMARSPNSEAYPFREGTSGMAERTHQRQF